MTKRDDLERDAGSRLVMVLAGLLAVCEDKTAPAEARIAQLIRVLRHAIEAEERKRHGSSEPGAAHAATDHPDGAGPKV